MYDPPVPYPLNTSSVQLQQQELQLRQFTLNVMSQREREKVRASPEPRLEIMRPVSPFQNKRPLAHQQAQTAPQAQIQRDQRIWTPPSQVHSTNINQPYTHTGSFQAQEANQASIPNGLNNYPNSRMVHPGSRARQQMLGREPRGPRSKQRDADISPALKMMNYDTSFTTSSSEQSHGQVSSASLKTVSTLAPPERSDANRSTSPEGGRKRNPGWRKPVPKYIQTPPSTPPTAASERLPSTREREEQIPLIPPSSSSTPDVQSSRPNISSFEGRSEPAPPSHSQPTPTRPARAATEPHVPVMLRDLTASKTRVGTIQQPAQAHMRSNVLMKAHKASVTASNARNASQTNDSPSSMHTLAVSQVRAPAPPRAPPQAHTNRHDENPQQRVTVQTNASNLQLPEDRGERRAAIVHPQPRKVPSIQQLVHMVLPSRSPSRTPSPGIPPSVKDISAPLPVRSPSPARPTAVTTQAVVPSLSLDPHSPLARKEAANARVLSGALLQPEQVHLPPSASSSARSSPRVSPYKPTIPLQSSMLSNSPRASPRRATSPLPSSRGSVSPRPSPRSVTAPLPQRSRSRSPTPAVVPQSKQAPPSSVPQPTSISIVAPKRRASTQLRNPIWTKIAQKAESTVEQVKETHVVPAEARRESPFMERIPSVSVRKQVKETHVVATEARRESPPMEGNSSVSGRRKDASTDEDSSPSMGGSFRCNKTLTASEECSTSQESEPSSTGRHAMADQTVMDKTTVLKMEHRALAPVREDRHDSNISAPVVHKDTDRRATHDCARGQALFGAMREDDLPKRPFTTTVAQTDCRNLPPVENVVVLGPSHGQTPSSRFDSGRGETASVKQTVNSLEKQQPYSSRPSCDSNERPMESFTGVAQAPACANDLVKSRPAPVPMKDRIEVSRQSGLATPPDTPPGTVESRKSEELSRSIHEERDFNEQQLEASNELVLNSFAPELPPPPTASSARHIMRREALIQDERSHKESVAETCTTLKSIMPSYTIDLPPAAGRMLAKETSESLKLLPERRQPIANAVTEITDSSSSTKPRSQLKEDVSVHRVQLPKRESPRSQIINRAEVVMEPRYTVCGALIAQAEHATKEPELPVHEIQTSRVLAPPNKPDKKSIEADEDYHTRPSRSPRFESTSLDPVNNANFIVKDQVPDASLAGNSTVSLTPPERPVRTHSPVPRKKVPQNGVLETNNSQAKTPVPATTEEDSVHSSIRSDPPARRPAEPSSRTHSSGSRKRGKVTRPRPDVAHSESRISAVEKKRLDYTDIAEPSNEPSPTPESQSSIGHIYPPRDYQSLEHNKRLPPNEPESNVSQSRREDSGWGGPASPPSVARPLPPTSQVHTPLRPQRHLHGHHKRLPAPEVKQTYRPPTPPIPSHYRKKRSNDLLPAEPTNFMKPAVHVIYPDTSTSQGASQSNDVAFNGTPNGTSRTQHAPIGNSALRGEEGIRSESPVSFLASEEQGYEEEHEVETYPQVPPKTRRYEGNIVNSHGSPSAGDRRPNFTIQHATREPVRYPSAPVGQARAHILMLPPSSDSSRSRDQKELSFDTNLRPRRNQQPRATKAARSQSEKLLRKNLDKVHPVARSRSTPMLSSRQRTRRGFWGIFGVWARAFVAKFKTWASPTSSPSHSSEYEGYYDTY